MLIIGLALYWSNLYRNYFNSWIDWLIINEKEPLK